MTIIIQYPRILVLLHNDNTKTQSFHQDIPTYLNIQNVLEKEVDNDKHEKDILTNRFAPVQLDMEETAEPDDLDGISGDFLDLEDFLEFLITLKEMSI